MFANIPFVLEKNIFSSFIRFGVVFTVFTSLYLASVYAQVLVTTGIILKFFLWWSVYQWFPVFWSTLIFEVALLSIYNFRVFYLPNNLNCSYYVLTFSICQHAFTLIVMSIFILLISACYLFFNNLTFTFSCLYDLALSVVSSIWLDKDDQIWRKCLIDGHANP